MQILAWALLAITSLSLLARKEGLVFGALFFISLFVGFIAFGFVGGLGYLALLMLGSFIFYMIERFLSAGVAIKLAKNDIANKERDIK